MSIAKLFHLKKEDKKKSSSSECFTEEEKVKLEKAKKIKGSFRAPE